MPGSLYLASSSPRRHALLATLGISFEHGGVDVDETPLPGEAVRDMVLRLAVAKASRARRQLPEVPVILGADTAVAVDNRIFGKPRSREHALAMLQSLSGREHKVMTALATDVDGTSDTRLSVTKVRFRKIDPAEAEAYWGSGEPEGKAGAYAIQGLGGMFVESLSGSYTGVIGLPVFETVELLRTVGIDALAGVSE